MILNPAGRMAMRWVLLACLLAGCGMRPPPYNPRGYGMGYQQPAYQVPAFGPGRPVTTNCTKFGAGVNCSTY
jgi:hypothetical protein